MDPITVLSIASATVNLVDAAAKLAKRIHELSEIGNVPKAFRDIKTKLPVIQTIISQTYEVEDSLNPEARAAFRELITHSLSQLRKLDKLLSEVTILPGDGKWQKARKAVRSLSEENTITRISNALRDNIGYLTKIQPLPMEKASTQFINQRRASEFRPEVFAASAIFMMPFGRDEYFIGREGILESIGSTLETQMRVAITGTGGIGKSQIAIEYAYRFKELQPLAHVFWVYGGSEARFYQAYKKLAQKLEIPCWDDPDVNILELVVDHLNECSSPYLLIIDNADDITQYWPEKYPPPEGTVSPKINLSLYIPTESPSGKILITSRNHTVSERLMRHGLPVPVTPMNQDEAEDLFRSKLHGDQLVGDQTVADIVRILEGLPLAVSQAAAYINAHPVTTAQYLAILETDDAEELLDEELHDSRRDDESLNSTFRTWKISFNSIADQHPRAAELLSLVAVLDRQSIPLFLLEDFKTVALNKCIAFLKGLHMISTHSGSGSLSLHRLTQKFVRLSLRRSGKLRKFQAWALACVTKVYPTEIGVQEWERCDLLSPHVETVIGYEHVSPYAQCDLASLLCWAADFDIERGLYQQALRRSKESLDLFEGLVDQQDERLAASTWLYGRLRYYEAHSEQDLEEAAKLLERAIKISQPKSLHFAESAFELAHLYFDIGKEKECLDMGRASYQCWNAMEGSASTRTLDNMHDYSLELAMFGHEAEAVSNWEKIISLCPQSDATRYTKAIYYYRSLACIVEFRDDYATAETLYAKLMSLSSAIYHPEHTHVFDYRLSHAEMIMRQGRYEEAIDNSREIIKLCQNKSEWRILYSAYETLAECYRLKGDFHEEEGLRRECLRLPTHYLSDANLEAIEASQALARCLLNLSRQAEALVLLEKVLSWRVQNQGGSFKETIVTIELIGICKSQLGSMDDAISYFLRAISLDPPPVSVARLLNNTCCMLIEQGVWPALESRCRELLQHPDIKFHNNAVAMLVTSLEKQGRLSEAVETLSRLAPANGQKDGRTGGVGVGDGGTKGAEDAPKSPIDADAATSMIIGKIDGDSDEKNNLFDSSSALVPPISLLRVSPDPVQPPYDLQEARRFGRMFHPRTWSA